MTEEQKQQTRSKRRQQKLAVLKYYSKSEVPTCQSCGFKDVRALTIDHINNNGAEHRKMLGSRASDKMHRWLIAEGFPEGFQVLCSNCQLLKRYGDKDYLEDSINTKYKKCIPDINTSQT